jgi:hypothetical protein
MQGEHGSMDAHDGCQDARTPTLEVQKSRNLDTVEIISSSTRHIPKIP